jgi:hypothetical protein
LVGQFRNWYLQEAAAILCHGWWDNMESRNHGRITCSVPELWKDTATTEESLHAMTEEQSYLGFCLPSDFQSPTSASCWWGWNRYSTHFFSVPHFHSGNGLMI